MKVYNVGFVILILLIKTLRIVEVKCHVHSKKSKPVGLGTKCLHLGSPGLTWAHLGYSSSVKDGIRWGFGTGRLMPCCLQSLLSCHTMGKALPSLGFCSPPLTHGQGKNSFRAICKTEWFRANFCPIAKSVDQSNRYVTWKLKISGSKNLSTLTHDS